ncbi:MAG: helix-turn-helix transcriptional regulator, partial [Melioribacteraceae bacterium]
VEEAKRMLQDKEFDNLTILSIAYESGFKNKSSFNNAFKKFTGFTPSEFKQSESDHD